VAGYLAESVGIGYLILLSKKMKYIITDKTAPALGPYSQAVSSHGILYTSGQIGLKPNGEVAGETIEAQTHQVMLNLQNVLEEAGSTWKKVLKCTIYLADLNDFDKVNQIYASYFDGHKPARECVQVAKVPKGLLIEISCIASV
jgi:2-iminobutanoate/2-iminopropanoate deaminase